MKFKVGRPSIAASYGDCFVIEVKGMYGDADGYGSLSYGPFHHTEQELMTSFIEFLDRMAAAYPHGRGGYDDYYHVEGFKEWMDADSLTQEEYDALPKRIKELSQYWLNEPQGDGMQASYNGFKVFYYNPYGVKYDVEVVR